MDELRPGTTAHFDWLNAQMRQYWKADSAYRARSLSAMGILDATTTLNTMKKETKRTTPPSAGEVTAVEVTVWDNWSYNGGKRPSERLKQPNYDKQRWKIEVEIFNQPEGEPIYGGGNASPNSIYKGTALGLDHASLIKYLAEKRAPKKGKGWVGDNELLAWADELESLSSANPDIHVGPLVWTLNKKSFNRGMGIAVEDIGDPKQMRVTLIYPDGAHKFSRWVSKGTGGHTIKSGDGYSTGVQCRATNRADQSAWRTSKLA